MSVMHVKFMYYYFVLLEHLGSEQLFESSHSASDNSSLRRPGIYMNLLFVTYKLNPYPTAFPYGNGMVLHFYQQQESSTTKTVHKVINKGLKTYV